MNEYTRSARDVIAAECEYISKDPNAQSIGLAFSGGGIRSASFAMGVMQALVADNRLKQMDYLSTVSGGGYLGASLTWFLSRKMPDGKPYGVEPENFPFGRKRRGGRESDHNVILDYIRQHGNYLVPGYGLNALSVVATILRTMFVSFAVYFTLLAAGFALLMSYFPVLQQDSIWISAAYGLLVIAALCSSMAVLYSLATFFTRIVTYRFAVNMQRLFGALTLLFLVVLVLGLLPLVHSCVGLVWDWIGRDRAEAGGSVAAVSTIIGGFFATLQHLRQIRAKSLGGVVSVMQIVLGVGFLLFGIVYGAYVAALSLASLPVLTLWALLGAISIVALACNVNQFGFNRMYRDRLMETFMPDEETVDAGKWAPAQEANTSRLQDMCTAPNQRPYHLINCNIVLVDSRMAKYRGRRGDSFTLSPLYCGSDATGWRQTKHYLYNRFRSGLTLPTAMAISGAAANPNSGVAGTGPTTNRLVSTLMSLLNLRLGFWADNPNLERSYLPPNYLYPGLKGGIYPTGGLNETHRAIELTDGGHYENLAIYELLRRRLDLIVVSDAGADGGYAFADLGSAIERARVDFGASITFLDDYPLQGVIPGSDTGQSDIERASYNLAARGFAIARIEHAAEPDKAERRVGHLLYIKPTLTARVSADVLAYKKACPTFPHQTTLDQFFDERQFEAYRELGYYLGWQLLEDGNVKSMLNAADVQTQAVGCAAAL